MPIMSKYANYTYYLSNNSYRHSNHNTWGKWLKSRSNSMSRIHVRSTLTDIYSA